MKNGTYSNTIQIIGLNSELYNVPKRKFILYFGDNEKTDSEYAYPEINGRVE